MATMAGALSPYDIGHRLRPRAWVEEWTARPAPDARGRPAAADDFGRVDMVDDTGAVVMTLYVERAGPGYLLRIEGLRPTVPLHAECI